MDKRYPIGVTVLVIAVAFGIWWSQETPSEHDETEKHEITIVEASQPVFSLLYVAEGMGYLEDEGLEVTYQSTTSGKEALQNVVDGEADLATAFETPVVLQTIAGEELSVITELHHSTKNTALVARTDAEISSPKDLADKSIAITKGSNGEFFLFLFLTSNGVSLDSVRFVDAKPQEMVSLLTAGTVDAVATWNPHLLNVQEAFGEEDAIITYFSDEYTESSVLVGMKDFVEENPEAMEKLLRALVRAEDFLNENEEESIQMVIDRLEGQQTEETIRGVWDDFNAEIRLSNILLTILSQEAAWLIDNGLVEGEIPDFRGILEVDHLKSVKPNGVTIY